MTLMIDYEKEDLNHSEIHFYCPACGQSAIAFACDLEKNSQVVCPHCDCINTVELEERKDGLNSFWEKVKKAKDS